MNERKINTKQGTEEYSKTLKLALRYNSCQPPHSRARIIAFDNAFVADTIVDISINDFLARAIGCQLQHNKRERERDRARLAVLCVEHGRASGGVPFATATALLAGHGGHLLARVIERTHTHTQQTKHMYTVH